MEKLFLGIDLGTSAIKLVLIDNHKRLIAQVTESYESEQLNTGWIEIDPEEWFRRMENGLDKLFEEAEAGNVAGIGVTGQMHTLITLDENGSPVRPAMMWNDIRTKELIPELKAVFAGIPEGEYISRTISTGSPAANLYWIKQNEPDRYKRIRKILIGPDYLVYRLTGKYSTDFCEASTSCLYEIDNRRWSEPIRQFLELEDDVFAPLHGSAEVIGTVLPEIAQRFGIPETAAVLVGTGDNPATAISTGCLGKGYPVISLGTSGIFMMPVRRMENQEKGKRILFSFDGTEYYNLIQGAVQATGNSVDWWYKTILEVSDYSALDEWVMPEIPEHSPLMFYPHLGGEKTLYGDPSMKGSFLGLDLTVTRESMTYAMFEGFSFAFRELAEKMNLPLDDYDSVKVVGGGANSRVWLQVLSNVLNKKVAKMDGMVGPAYGVALLAAGQTTDAAEISALTEATLKEESCFEPVPEMVRICEKRYSRYLRIRDGLKYIMDEDMDL